MYHTQKLINFAARNLSVSTCKISRANSSHENILRLEEEGREKTIMIAEPDEGEINK
jgi:hypothetical protein